MRGLECHIQEHRLYSEASRGHQVVSSGEGYGPLSHPGCSKESWLDRDQQEEIQSIDIVNIAMAITD